MMPEVSGEIYPKQNYNSIQPADFLPSVMVEEGVEHVQPAASVENNQNATSQETEDSLLLLLESIDDELRRAKSQVRSYQEMALKYQSNNELLNKLNEESSFFQKQYDEFSAKKDQVLRKLKSFRN